MQLKLCGPKSPTMRMAHLLAQNVATAVVTNVQCLSMWSQSTPNTLATPARYVLDEYVPLSTPSARILLGITAPQNLFRNNLLNLKLQPRSMQR